MELKTEEFVKELGNENFLKKLGILATLILPGYFYLYTEGMVFSDLSTVEILLLSVIYSAPSYVISFARVLNPDSKKFFNDRKKDLWEAQRTIAQMKDEDKDYNELAKFHKNFAKETEGIINIYRTFKAAKNVGLAISITILIYYALDLDGSTWSLNNFLIIFYIMSWCITEISRNFEIIKSKFNMHFSLKKKLPKGQELKKRAIELGVSTDEILDTQSGIESEPILQKRVLEAEQHLREHRLWIIAVISMLIALISSIATWIAVLMV